MCLIWEDLADVDFDFVDIAHEETDFFVAGQRQQCSLSEERERLTVGLNLEGRDIRLACNVSASTLHTVLYRNEEIPADRREKLETVHGVGAVVGCDVIEGDLLR